MIFHFNKAQLGRNLEAKLNSLLTEFQKGTDVEIVIWPLSFPEQFSIQVGDDFTVVVWDVVDGEYKIMPSPDREPEPEPESLTETKPEPELDLSPVLERSQALARALANLTKPLERDHRFIVWADFLTTLLEELV